MGTYALYFMVSGQFRPAEDEGVMQAIELCPKSSAVLIRKILKAAFPGTKFGVVTERGSMVSSVRISWTDGPTQKQVERLAGQFEMGRFDGMTDSYNYDTGADRYLIVDGQTYRTGLKYVFTNRTISPELANRCIKQVAEFWGGVEVVPVAVESQYSSGEYVLTPDIGRRAVRSDLDWHRNDWHSSIRRCAEDPAEFTRGEV